MEGLLEPLPARLRRRLRRAVLELVLSERRHRFPAILHVGTPGGAQEVLAVEGDPTDHALRTDLVAALLRRAGVRSDEEAGPIPPDEAPLVWLTRPGDLDPQDLDMAWLAAARAASLEAEVPLIMVIVTRHGWRDPRSGLQQTWKRLRAR